MEYTFNLVVFYREGDLLMERHNGPSSTHPLLADERVDLRDGDNLRHEHTQPLGVEEVELTQLGLEVTVVEEHPTLMQKSDSLRGGVDHIKGSANYHKGGDHF